MSQTLFGRPIFVRDPRTLGWFVSGNIPLLLTILASYLYFVKVSGPRFMKNRKPMEHLKPVILVYNAVMTALNVYFSYNFFRRTYFGGGYSFFCQGINFDARDQRTMELLVLCWWYLWVRVCDFLDTAFFILRKKDSHISFLHVVHHCLVVFNGWFGAGYGPDGQIMLTVCLNSFVHVIMHSYYFLSVMGPRVRKYLWWKRYLTQIQIGQFAVLVLHAAVPLFKDCGFPLTHLIIGMPQGLFFFGMFVKFYIEAYSRSGCEPKKVQ